MGRVTRSREAIEAYKKCLGVEALSEAKSSLQTKLERIRKDLPSWIQRSGSQQEAMSLVQRMQRYLIEQRRGQAERIAEEMLHLIGRTK